MQNLKTFEEFGGGNRRSNEDPRFTIGKNSSQDNMGYKLVKNFDKITIPEKPFMRNLTDEETKKLFTYFRKFSWSPPDAKGRIILGGGNSEAGVYYITPEDLETLPVPDKQKDFGVIRRSAYGDLRRGG